MSAVNSSNPHQFEFDHATGVCYRTLDFLGFPYYRVGDDGSVWSCRVVGETKRLSSGVWKRRRFGRSDYGRLKVPLFPGGDQFFVHHLVLLAFVGPCPKGMECCHNDGNAANNTIANLRWDTHRANVRDAHRHNTAVRGVRHGMARLTEDTVRMIRQEYATGDITMRLLAAKYGVCVQHVCDIIHRLTWAHID